MDFRYDGRVAIVTGAGHGLGRSHAEFLASRGAKLVVNDFGGSVDGRGGASEAADQVVATIREAGGEAVANYASVADRDGAKAIVATALDTFGGVDIVINNAGILRDKSFHNMTLEDFEAVVAVHFTGSVYVTHAAYPVMREAGYGRIVMTTSAAGLYGNFGQTNYGAAKLAQVGLMNSLKIEGRKYDVLVNTIAPVAATRMTEGILPPGVDQAFSADHVTAAAAYYASEACQVSGEIMEVGAGYYGKVALYEAEGTWAPKDAPATPETFAALRDAACDMSEARAYETGTDALMKVFGQLAQR